MSSGTWFAEELDVDGLYDLCTRPQQPQNACSKWLWIISGAGSLVFLAAIVHTLLLGIGAWGNRNPTMWGFGIINFVFWIGIGHAGTFISSFALLLNQGWRTSINRVAETITLLALVNAGLFPLLHLGRYLFFYWLVPYPGPMQLWPQFRSSLTWDIAAISTYVTVSFLFWYLGLLPDLAAQRDRAKSRRLARLYGVLSLGWRGRAKQWRMHQAVYCLLAGLAAPLVISVHSVVSLDFAIGKVVGWNSTIFPPYFVIGALLSGFAAVLLVLIPLRWRYRWHAVVTERHLDALALLLLLMAVLIGFCYLTENVWAWYIGGPYIGEQILHWRPFGRDAVLCWSALLGNVILPQVLWSRRCRHLPWVLCVVSAGVLWGMWVERYILVATTMSYDFLPAAWDGFVPRLTDIALLGGSVCLFCFGLLSLLRWLPLLPYSDLLEAAREQGQLRQPAAAAVTVQVLAQPLAGAQGFAATCADPQSTHALLEALRQAGISVQERLLPHQNEALQADGASAGRVRYWAGAAGLLAVPSAMFIQWWCTQDQGVRVSGIPTNEWLPYVPIGFESGVLAAAVVAVGGLLYKLGLPKLHVASGQEEPCSRTSYGCFVLLGRIELAQRDKLEQILQTHQIVETYFWEEKACAV